MIIRRPQDLGSLIRDQRRKLGMTQSQLASQTGVSRKWLVDVESGKRAGDMKLILRTLNAMGIVLNATGRVRKQPHALDINAVIDASRKT